MPFDSGFSNAYANDDRPDFDPAVADQITTQILSMGRHNFEVNAMAARNDVAANAAMLTLGVQQGSMSLLKSVTELSPLDAAVADTLKKSQDMVSFAGLNAVT